MAAVGFKKANVSNVKPKPLNYNAYREREDKNDDSAVYENNSFETNKKVTSQKRLNPINPPTDALVLNNSLSSRPKLQNLSLPNSPKGVLSPMTQATQEKL
jgi:hypothetical protein